MTKQNFAIMHNLDGLSEAGIQEYLCEASIYFGLPPELNGLDTIYMNSEDGMRKRVAYARKGTTDILRDLRGIGILSLVQHDGPGYVSFMATGINSKGRQEIAVGAHETEGLKGKRLADAVATAQTRALRRLTLQFVGGGLLDISEVNSQTTDIGSSTASLAQLADSPVVMPPPRVVPAVAPGRDITPPADTKSDITSPPEEVKPVESTISLGTKSYTVASEPKRRGRRKRNTVDIASPGQQMEMPMAHLDAEGKLTPISPNADIPESQPTATRFFTYEELSKQFEKLAPPPPFIVPTPVVLLPASQVNPAPAAPPTPPLVDLTAVEKMKEYRARLSKYSMEILPKAGMMPTEGIGGVTMKLRKFALIQVGATDVTKLTLEQWEELFEFLDGYTAANGAEALVKYIDKAIGAA